jgi:uncharacterized membrane protein YphA (DoxX/SURF4 family)
MNSKVSMVLRILLGLLLLVFGINKFANFMPAMEMPEPAGAFFGAMAATGFMIPLVAIVEIAVGALLVLKKWVPFALVALFPITIGFILFHLALAPAGIGAAALVAILHVALLYNYRDSFKGLFV